VPGVREAGAAGDALAAMYKSITHADVGAPDVRALVDELDRARV
jgi:hypothetical protein